MTKYGFQSHLTAEDLEDGRTRKLIDPLKFIGHDGWSITIPKGFKSDGASVPKLFHSIISRWGKHGTAAVLHDYLYKIGHLNKEQCDDLFLDAMLISGVWAGRALTMYYAVKWLGGWAWDEHRARDKK